MGHFDNDLNEKTFKKLKQFQMMNCYMMMQVKKCFITPFEEKKDPHKTIDTWAQVTHDESNEIMHEILK